MIRRVRRGVVVCRGGGGVGEPLTLRSLVNGSHDLSKVPQTWFQSVRLEEFRVQGLGFDEVPLAGLFR